MYGFPNIPFFVCVNIVPFKVVGRYCKKYLGHMLYCILRAGLWSPCNVLVYSVRLETLGVDSLIRIAVFGSQYSCEGSCD